LAPEPGRGIIYEKPSQRHSSGRAKQHQILVSDLTPTQLAEAKNVHQEQNTADNSSSKDKLNQDFTRPKPKNTKILIRDLKNSN
jgi:hypothetical protein